jgi:hypothetical protein
MNLISSTDVRQTRATRVMVVLARDNVTIGIGGLTAGAGT